MNNIDFDISRKLRAKIDQIVNHSAFFFIHEFNVRLKHQANFDLPPGLDVDADGKARQKLCKIWLAKKFGRVFGFNFAQNAVMKNGEIGY